MSPYNTRIRQMPYLRITIRLFPGLIMQKHPAMQKLICACFVVSLFLLGCGPKEEPQNPVDGNTGCIQLFDINGAPGGLYGPCTSSTDWGKVSLNTIEQGLFDFVDSINISPPATDAIQMFAPWPNPVQNGGSLYCSVRSGSANESVRVKVVVTDAGMNVILRSALRLKTNGTFALRIDDPQFKNGEYYRLYYRVNTNAQPKLFEGYGTFLVCKTAINDVNAIKTDCL